MDKTTRVLGLVIIVFCIGMTLQCEESKGTKVEVEKLDKFTPNLPSVPTLPPPPHPTQYSDQSYSIYGVRRMIKNTINTALGVTGYIAKVYQPPPCPEGEKRCPPASAPHLWIADTPNEEDPDKLLLVAGYAENQQQIDEAIEAARKGKPLEVPEGSEAPPIPTDLFKGAKVKIQGRFGYSTEGFATDRGFQHSDGLLQYTTHQLIEPSSEAPDIKKK